MAETCRRPGLYTYRTNQHVVHNGEGGFIIEPKHIEIEDIAYSLSREVRWCGHTRRDVTVAEHCLMVMEMVEAMGAPPPVVMQALMHDATECYTGDVPSWVKVEIPALRELERRVWKAICDRFPYLLFRHDKRVKQADYIALFVEAACLSKADLTKWEGFDTYGGLAHSWIEEVGPMPAEKPPAALLETTFLNCHRTLVESCDKYWQEFGGPTDDSDFQIKE